MNPQAPFRFYKDRLRQTIAEPELIGDADLLTLLNEGYRRLCERSGCLPTLATISLVDGTTEYDLPADWFETRMVASGGVRLDYLPYRHSLADYGSGAPVVYYAYGSKIGFAPTPTSGSVTVLYNASPTPLTGFDDTVDPRCLPECRYGIVQYVRWRLTQLDGGAQGIRKADYERQLFEQAVQRLRDRSRQVLAVEQTRMRSIVEAGRALR